MIWNWRQSGRSQATVAVLCAVWAVILTLWLVLDASLLIVAALALATLPVILDIARARDMAIEVHGARLTWQSGARRGATNLTAETTVSLRRRFDGGLRIVVIDGGGRETRLPPELAPPLAPLEAALQQTAARVRRDPFRLI